jgi:hypothetical protein
MQNDFFPSSDYKLPETSNYMKLTEGEHTLRVLSSAIVGYVYFNKENKPVRSRSPFDEMPTDIKKDGRINHFWAFVVWNYEAQRIQILEISQKTIQTQMKALIDNAKWGNPKSYDITITRKGTGLQDTEYAVMPNPHSEVDKDIVEKYTKSKINLNALYEGLDPFTVDKD